jgi:hypothetical protein
LIFNKEHLMSFVFIHYFTTSFSVVPYPHDIPAAIAQQQANPAPIMQTAVCPSPVVQTPPVIPCRFGGQCAATECKFWHPPVSFLALWVF